jgi:hypothetical protein
VVRWGKKGNGGFENDLGPRGMRDVCMVSQGVERDIWAGSNVDMIFSLVQMLDIPLRLSKKPRTIFEIPSTLSLSHIPHKS